MKELWGLKDFKKTNDPITVYRWSSTVDSFFWDSDPIALAVITAGNYRDTRDLNGYRADVKSEDVIAEVHMNNSFRIGYIVDPDKLFNVELIPDFRDKFQPADLEAFWEDYWEKGLQEIQKIEFGTAYDESDASIFDDVYSGEKIDRDEDDEFYASLFDEDNVLSGEEFYAVLREESDMDEKFDAFLFWGDFDKERLPF